MEIKKVDLVNSNLIRVKLKHTVYRDLEINEDTDANTYRLVHPRGSYYISIGLRTELVKRGNKSKTVEMQFFF